MKLDTLWGIERHKGSELEGRLVCAEIYLYSLPGSKNIVARLKHNTKVEILGTEQRDYRTYYKVIAVSGLNRKAGWVLDTLLKEKGK